jgi:uncharacterized membrane protein
MTDATAPHRNYWRIAGVALAFIWFFAGGIGHFIITNTFTAVVPPYIPFPREMVYFTGVCEIAGALALLYKPLRSIAGIMLALLAICVTPVHIQMLIEADKYAALGPAILWGRLIIQPIFIWIVWTTTRPAPPSQSVPA